MTEGAEWDRAYREKVGGFRQQEADIAVKRDQLLGVSVQQVMATLRLLHEEGKEKRTLYLHTGSAELPQAGIKLWCFCATAGAFPSNGSAGG